MQDSLGTTDLRPSRPVSRRDALRYAAAASALAGLGAAAAGATAPVASAAAPTLIDFAMRQIPAQDIRAAGHAGVINYVSTSRPGSSMGAKPITLPYAQSLAAAGLAIVSNYQYGKPGGTAPSDFTAGTPEASPTPVPPGSCTPPQAAVRVRRSSSASTTTSTGKPGTALSCNGFRNQLRDRRAAHRHLRRHQCVPVGHGRRRNRTLMIARPRLGLADAVVVKGPDLPRRRSLPAGREHRVESGAGGRRARSRRQRCLGSRRRPVEPASLRS